MPENKIIQKLLLLPASFLEYKDHSSRQLSYEATDSGFIAQLVRVSPRYRDVMGSNLVEVLTFSGF